MPFVKGQSGNKSGRPKTDQVIKDWALVDARSAYKLWVQAMNDTSLEMDTRLKAANNIVERAFGKAAQGVELSGANGEALTIGISYNIKAK